MPQVQGQELPWAEVLEGMRMKLGRLWIVVGAAGMTLCLGNMVECASLPQGTTSQFMSWGGAIGFGIMVLAIAMGVFEAEKR